MMLATVAMATATAALDPEASMANIPAATSLLELFATFGALLPAVVAVTAWLVSRFKMTATGKQVTAWAVSLALTLIGWWLQIGYLTELTWWLAAIHGLALGLAANGFFDISIIKLILSSLFPPKGKRR